MSFKKFLIPFVALIFVSVVYAANVCCEKTVSKDFCVYTDSKYCSSDSKTASISCEQTSYCNVGCCYSSDEGRCFKNAPKAECEAMNGTWDPDANCEVQQCKKGCCTIGSEAFFVTPLRCKLEASSFPNATMGFDEAVQSEPECIAKSKAEDVGCCVSGTECKFGKRSSCSTASVVQSGNGTGDGFYKDMLCSNDNLKCDCAKQQKTGCVPDSDAVYWFDSCGNRENIYSADKVASYNNGYVLPKSLSCKLKGAFDPSCGNCDYSSGTLCGSSPSKVKMKFGDYTCRDVSCKDTYADSVSLNSGKPKKNGESWCIYDTTPGQARDAVGSRHFRHLCVNGEEFVEPCRDFREELCIQGIMNYPPAESAHESFNFVGKYVESSCRDNRWEDCFACNALESCGGDCSSLSGDAQRECCVKKCCSDVSFRDCFFMPAGIARGIGGVCVPDVPPGLSFWGVEPQPISSSTSSQSTASLQTSKSSATGAAVSTASGTSTITGAGGGSGSGACSQADMECSVTWHRGGVSRIFNRNDWKCVNNCQCTSHEWVVAGNTLCKAMGDCGAYFNVVGKITTDGYANSASAERKWFTGSKLKESEVGDWKTLSSPGTGTLDNSQFSEFFGKTALSLSTIVATGVYSGFAHDWAKGSFTSGLFGGIAGAGKGVGSYIFSLGKKGGISEVFSHWEKAYGTKAEVRVSKFEAAKGGTTGDIAKDAPLGKMTYTGNTKQVADILNTNNRLVSEYNREIYQEYLKEEGVKKFGDQQSYINFLTKEQSDSYYIGLMDRAEVGGLAKFKSSGGMWEMDILKDNSGFSATEPITKTTTVSEAYYTNWMGWLNTIMWVYTVYQVVDVFYSEDHSETYRMSCGLWQPPDGGRDCEKCNQDNNNKPCSEYRCKSLGKLCSLINKGTAEEKCVSLHPNDVNSPVINPWKEVLPSGFTLTEVTAEGNKGFKINQKLKPFQSITIGIKTDEPAQCKFGSENSVGFDLKTSYFGDQLYVYEHQITFVLPSDLATPEALKATNQGMYNLYIRCKDASGNRNNRDYFIRFTLEPTPDLTAPVIERTSVESGAYAPHNVSQTSFSVYTNEPAECRWNFNDTEFDLMANRFVCADSGFSLSSVYYGLYECKTDLKVYTEGSTDYFIRCKDRRGNVNTESYPFSLTSTLPLLIDSVSPSGVLYTSNVELKVVTSAGANYGDAKCGYSNSNVSFLSMVEFYESNSSIHKQPLVLDRGDYTYYVACRDVAGNEASSSISFRVDVDLESPKVLFIYAEGSVLHMELNEPSNCQYSTNSTINYGSGVQMTGSDSYVHELSLGSPVYYVSCIDKYTNEADYIIYP